MTSHQTLPYIQVLRESRDKDVYGRILRDQEKCVTLVGALFSFSHKVYTTYKDPDVNTIFLKEMSESEIVQRATNPTQYDSEDLVWETEGSTESPRTLFYLEHLKKYLPDLKGKRFLDIGAGNGWLVAEAMKMGASHAMGIEPSVKNNELKQRSHPEVEMIQSSLQDFNTPSNFDIATSVMAFSHIKDLDSAFKKINGLLNPNGELIIIVPDFDYFRLPRFGYTISEEALNEDEYAISITRPDGTIADIVRRNIVYQNEAKKEGFQMVAEIPILPTPTFIKNAAKYEQVKNKPLSQLLKFKK